MYIWKPSNTTERICSFNYKSNTFNVFLELPEGSRQILLSGFFSVRGGALISLGFFFGIMIFL